MKVTRNGYGAILWYHCPNDCGKTFPTLKGLKLHLKFFCRNKEPKNTQIRLEIPKKFTRQNTDYRILKELVLKGQTENIHKTTLKWLKRKLIPNV